MKIDSIEVDQAIHNAKQLLEKETDLSPVLKASLDMLILLVTVLLNRNGLNSRNSSKPPASDPNRLKSSRSKSNKASGGQKGHIGKTLKKIDDPDVIEAIKIDRRTLPRRDSSG